MQHVDTEGMAGWIPGGSPSRQIVAAAGIQEEVEHLRTQVITDYCTVLYTGNPVYRYTEQLRFIRLDVSVPSSAPEWMPFYASAGR